MRCTLDTVGTARRLNRLVSDLSHHSVRPLERKSGHMDRTVLNQAGPLDGASSSKNTSVSRIAECWTAASLFVSIKAE